MLRDPWNARIPSRQAGADMESARTGHRKGNGEAIDGPHPPIGNCEAIERKRPIEHFVIVHWVGPYDIWRGDNGPEEVLATGDRSPVMRQ